MHKRSCVLFAFGVLFYSAQGYTISIDHRSKVLETRSTAENPQQPPICGFKGNNDIYGIGIRIGYYTQAISVWFANYFVLSEAKNLRPTNLLFLFAMFIGLIWLSHQESEAYAIEAFLLLQLLFATWYIGVLNRGRFSKKYWRFSPMRSVISSATMLTILGYNAWFWWKGLDRMTKTSCGSFVFFMAKVELFGWYRSAYRALAIPAVIFGVLLQVGRSVELLQYLRAGHDNKPDYYHSLAMSLKIAAGFDHPSARENRDSTAGPTTQCPQGPLQPDSVPGLGATPPCVSALCSTLQPPNTNPQGANSVTFAAAINTPLPDSPTSIGPSSEISLPAQSPSHIGTTPPSADIASFNDLLEAELFLQGILDVSVAKHSLWHYDLHIPLLRTPLRIFLWSLHSPKTINRRWKAVSIRRPFRLSILLPLFQHVHSLYRYPFYSYIIMTEKAMLSPQYKYISPRAMEAMLDFQTAQLPEDRPFWTFFFQALFSLSVCIGMILSIELAIRWNSISDIETVGQVGQLIPAVIGIGGLVRVLWVWISRGDAGVEEEDGVAEEVRECTEAYKTAKQVRGEGIDIRLRVPDYI